MSSSSSDTPSSEAPRRKVDLTRRAQTRFVSNAVDGFRFTVAAENAVLMPAEVFRYLRRPYNPVTGVEADEFDGVCSLPDLEEMPAGAPTGSPPFFRLAEIDLVFRSMSEADEAWAVIQADVAVLVRTMDLADDLGVAETVEIGG